MTQEPGIRDEKLEISVTGTCSRYMIPELDVKNESIFSVDNIRSYILLKMNISDDLT